MCAFILEELPQVALAKRKKAITDFQGQLQGCTAAAPTNLLKYLEAEKKKCK